MFFKILKTKTNTIGKSALLLTIFSITSSVLAVVRDKIFATKFGAGETLDTYLAAFKIPDVVFLLTATLISAFVIIPLFEQEEKRGREYLQNFIDKIFSSFALFIFIIGIIVFFLTPFLAKEFFGGFSPEQLERLVSYSRIMLLSPIFMGLSFVFMGLNQKHSYFFPVALTGIFYNLSIIFGALILYPFFGFIGVVLGVVFGAFLYLLLQLPSVFAEGLFIKKIRFFRLKDFWRILRISAPRSIALALSDIILIFLIARATHFGDGSVTMLNFSLNIFMVPINIVAISYSVAVFPKLAKAFVENKVQDLKNMSRDVIARILFFGIPISFFFIFYSDVLVGFLLGSKKFGLEEIEKTSFFVSVLSIVIVFQAISIMVVRIFYAMGKTWIPLFVNSIVALFLIFLVYFFNSNPWIKLILKNLDDQSVGIANLVLSYMIAFIFGSLLIRYIFAKMVKNFSLLKNSFWLKKILISIGAILFSKEVYYFMAPDLKNSFWYFTLNLFIAGVSFLIGFTFFSEILKEKNYLDFKKKIIFNFKKVLKKV